MYEDIIEGHDPLPSKFEGKNNFSDQFIKMCKEMRIRQMLVSKLNSLTNDYLKRHTKNTECLDLDSTNIYVNEMMELFHRIGNDAEESIQDFKEWVMDVRKWPREIAQNFGGTGAKKHHEYFNYIDVHCLKQGNAIDSSRHKTEIII